MKALQQIVKRVAENPSQRWALATLVQTEGSTYRKPGARLLIEADGKTLGVLSGGCLEEEIARYGQDVIATGSPVLLSFDTRRLYGCDGRLKIIIEPLRAAELKGNLMTEIGGRLRNRQLCRIRTCFDESAMSAMTSSAPRYRPTVSLICAMRCGPNALAKPHPVSIRPWIGPMFFGPK